VDVQAFRSELAAECGRVSQFYNAGRDSGITCYDLGHGVDIDCRERRLHRHELSAGPSCWLKHERIREAEKILAISPNWVVRLGGAKRMNCFGSKNGMAAVEFGSSFIPRQVPTRKQTFTRPKMPEGCCLPFVWANWLPRIIEEPAEAS
jgi:hypothetical protein